MKKKIFRSMAAGLVSVAMIIPSAANAVSTSVSASQLLGETSFENKTLPWQSVQTGNAEQNIQIQNGALLVDIFSANGADKEKWDLQIKHRDLDFKAGHTYEISFRAKASREDFELCSQIASVSGEELYFVLNEDEMINGPCMGGIWGKAAKLTEEYQTFSGTFTPEKDLTDVEWSFHYAYGTLYEGNAKDGDQIWFDDMSIICTSCAESDTPVCGYKEEPIRESVSQLLGETTFDEGTGSWKFIEANPAKQNCSVDDGALHIEILSAEGADREKWDLQMKHEALCFKKDHTYEVRFKAKSARQGMQISSQIASPSGEEYYFVLDKDCMTMGPYMDGKWGRITYLSTEYQTFKGIFTPTQDIENVEWVFQYASGTQYDGDTVNGDELWFDDMSIICLDCEKVQAPECFYQNPVSESPEEEVTVPTVEETSDSDDAFFGDANVDGSVTIADAATIFQSLSNPDKYILSKQGANNADVVGDGDGITVIDGLAIQAANAQLIESDLFPMTRVDYDIQMQR